MNKLHKHFTAKVLRKNFTDTERLLWKYLRAKQMEGCKFRRQEPIGSYIVDFVCHEKKMVIEVDGGQHSADRERDDERDSWLEGQGYRVLRFWNNEVLTNIKGVLEVIRGYLNHPPLTPPLKGGEVKEEHAIKGGELSEDVPSRERKQWRNNPIEGEKAMDIPKGKPEEPQNEPKAY
jgi:very-short-patch-repair endonuclease